MVWTQTNQKKWPTSCHFKMVNLLQTTALWNPFFFHDFLYMTHEITFFPSPSPAICDYAPFLRVSAVFIGGHGGSKCGSNRLRNTKRGWLQPWVLKTLVSIEEKHLVLSAHKADPHIQSNKKGFKLYNRGFIVHSSPDHNPAATVQIVLWTESDVERDFSHLVIFKR